MTFLFSWTMETFHGNHFLYLIKYSLPIEQADRINPGECTGSMMIIQKETNNNYQLVEDQSDEDINDDEKQPLFPQKNKYFDDEIDEALVELGFPSGCARGSLMSGIVRFLFFWVDAIYLMITISMILLHGVRNNFYDYPKWGQILGYILSGIMILFSVGVCVGLTWHFSLLLFPRIMKKLASELQERDDELQENDE
eukprot:326152_1